MVENIVELKNVTKVFPGVIALKNMSIDIKPSEIHGLIGENGAGKSTLIKVLTGVHIPESGEILIEGNKKVFKNPVQARNAGIACVYQELNIVKQLSVVDNIFMGNQKKKGLLLDYELMESMSREALEKLGFGKIDVNTECGKLGVGQQQIVEIARALVSGARLIIMDEPTSSLGKEEISQLMKTCRMLKSEGISILFVSHKLEELYELCDRVTVMRDGEHIVTDDVKNLSEEELIRAMVGRTLDNLYPKIQAESGEVLIEVRNLVSKGVVKNVSFKARAGEITGFAGLVGAGRTETMRAVFGADRHDSGEILIKGKAVTIKSPGDAIRKGIGFLTEDRKTQGLILSQNLRTNLILANMRNHSKGPFLDDKEIQESSSRLVDSLKIKISSLDDAASQLSGGNQQKLVIGKWVDTNADIYIFDEPTRGIDVGAKIEVYKLMNELVKQGKCLIMISSELPEILSMSDYVYVMRDGAITAEMSRNSKHFNSEDIMKAAWGGAIDDEN